MKSMSGKYVQQPGGYKAFIPDPLPPAPPIQPDEKLQVLLSRADRSVARLDGIGEVLPNPDLFVAMYVKKEALLSSQIEGTQASLEGILEFEANMVPRDDIDQVKEVVNYIKALNFGLKEIDIKPEISIGFIERLHTILIKGTRGSKHRGAFRRTQNWLGPAGSTVFEAIFIPPPPQAVPFAMQKLASFTNSPVFALSLIKAALVHAQFETIHPFIDGNGRIGRLLITCLLYRDRILSRPLLYLSYFLKKNRSPYYELLMKTRHESAWSAWLTFFLSGIIEVADQSSTAARDIIALKQKILQRLYEKQVSSIYAAMLVDLLFESPVVDVRTIDDRLHISKDTGTKLVNTFARAKILKEITGKQRYKKYLFSEYVDIIARGTREGTG